MANIGFSANLYRQTGANGLAYGNRASSFAANGATPSNANTRTPGGTARTAFSAGRTGASSSAGSGALSDFAARYTQEETGPSAQKMQEIRNLLRDLKQQQQMQQTKGAGGVFAGTLQEKMNDFLSLSGAPTDEDEEMASADATYNGKQVENKIRSAKTSMSAGQAVLTAKRKVQELKRKLNTGDGDPDDLHLALVHAERMEAVARKKKHHLELEELAKVTMERDEQKNRAEETADSIRGALMQLTEEEIAAKEDEIWEERLRRLDEITEQASEGALSENAKDQMIKDLADFGEEMLQQLEEAMALVEGMEVIDPHMDEQELKELKRKHRNQEEKAMVKADMDYLKEMIKRQLQKGAGVPGMGSGAAMGSGAGASGNPALFGAFSGSGAAAGGVGLPSVDLHV